MFKRMIAIFLALLMCALPLCASASDLDGEVYEPYADAFDGTLSLTAKSAVLMEKTSGEVLYEVNADEVLPPASVTKIMTLLLVFEALEAGTLAYEDMVPVSAYAASMGGSQAYMEEGEQMSVDEMLKAVFVSSCNDAAVALAEKISGSADVFVSRMNERAQELGMTNTHFENATGLDDTNMTTARDIAVMSRALIKYPKVREYATIWMDTIRDGQFGLSNTNKLVKAYNGITGLKTGFTSTAMYCLSATAERDGMELIAVVLAEPSSKERFNDAAELLNYGFANYSLLSYTLPEIADLRVDRGKTALVPVSPTQGTMTKLVKKGAAGEIEARINMPDRATAPIEKGQVVGQAEFYLGDEIIGTVDIAAENAVGEKSLLDYVLYVWLCAMGKV